MQRKRKASGAEGRALTPKINTKGWPLRRRQAKCAELIRMPRYRICTGARKDPAHDMHDTVLSEQVKELRGGEAGCGD
jgi:hypothetical protein